MEPILVTGGTGQLGREVVDLLVAAGRPVRVLSRSATAAGPATAAERVVGDLATGAGLAEATAGVGAIVHCASNRRDTRRVDLDGTRQLLEAARRQGQPHVVFVSIVAVDRVPVSYYRAKLGAERIVGEAGLPWTILRAAQFHTLIHDLLAKLARAPVVAVPRGWGAQPVDVRDVAARLIGLVDAGPVGRAPDFGGPKAYPVEALARSLLAATGRHRPVVRIPVPGKVSRALREGANLTPDQPRGIRTWEEFLADRYAR